MEKVALITGASRGIGKAIACELAKKNYTLFLTARDENKLKEVVKELSSISTSAIHSYPLDLSDKMSPRRLIKECIFEFGQIDVLINNAGMGIHKSIADTTEDDWDTIMMINAKAPFLFAKKPYPILKNLRVRRLSTFRGLLVTKDTRIRPHILLPNMPLVDLPKR